jgi:hypothetical protein
MLAPLTDADPRMVGGYQLQGRLGTGGMGSVYLGFDAEGRPTAVKVIRPEKVQDREYRVRFRREVTAACRVRGRYVAEVRAADVDAASPWMASDYIDGVSLATAIAERRRFDETSLLALASGLADALVAVHAAGVVHRDLKPSNILLAWDGPKIIDFGIAQHDGGTVSTGTGDLIGTIAWMAPEQLRGGRAGPAADVFAWGACVTFAALGRHPFPAESAAATAIRVLNDPPDTTGLPGRIAPIVLHALEKDPGRRPTAADLLGTLLGEDTRALTDASEAAHRVIIAGWAPPAAPALVGSGTSPGSPAGPSPGGTEPPADAGRRRTSRRLLVAGIALACILSAAGFALTAALGSTGSGHGASGESSGASAAGIRGAAATTAAAVGGGNGGGTGHPIAPSGGLVTGVPGASAAPSAGGASASPATGPLSASSAAESPVTGASEDGAPASATESAGGAPAPAPPASPSSSPSPADILDGGTAVLQNLSTQFCLDSNATGNAYTLGCNGGRYQKWTVSDQGRNTAVLRDVATGKCLDSNATGNAYTLRCNRGEYQKWTVIRSDYNTVALKDMATGRCLDSDANGNLYTLPCNGGSYQRWIRR